MREESAFGFCWALVFAILQLGVWRRWFEQYRGGVQISLVADLANLFIQAENDRRERLT